MTGQVVVNSVAEIAGRLLAEFLNKPVQHPNANLATNFALLTSTLQPADVLLIEGNTHISTAIKYLTQSTWSHAALYAGHVASALTDNENIPNLIEADVVAGVRTVPLSIYEGFHCRICRPVGLSLEDKEKVVQFATDRIGHRYDLRNVIDLARYLLPTPPVPTSWRRRLLALGSGDPTRAICSTLIAQAFQSIRYPILPDIAESRAFQNLSSRLAIKIMKIRHHSLFVPRDFDVSPYFEIVKPTLSAGFDYKSLTWES